MARAVCDEVRPYERTTSREQRRREFGMGRLDAKVAVITGGASGIGEATVRLFVEEDARVVIADIQDEKGETLADTLGGAAVYQHADVSQESEVQGAVARAVSEYGRLDCIFNNAGLGGVAGPIDQIPMEWYDVTMNILLRGVFMGMKHAVPVMKEQGGGSIISSASVAGLVAGYGSHVYSAAKAAIIQLTRTAAVELGESGIRVNCICPGGIATPIFKGLFGDVDDATAVEMVKPSLAQLQPIKRSGLGEDVAKAALWLASDDSTFVSGHALVVDGGLTAGRPFFELVQGLLGSQPASP
jgi:NAD(P)-dependent dehydrogenase (short-subunit alcohol dehydrogenase family)